MVMLPGLDGTGELFSPLLARLSSFDCQVISLPQSGEQDYETLIEYVEKRLPEDDFILIAESFSGPIAASLAKDVRSNMKGIIFVATFLSPPGKFLLKLAPFLPLQIFLTFPLAKYAHKFLFLGGKASNEFVVLFQRVVRGLPSQVLKFRLNALKLLSFSTSNIDIPAVYLRAASDKLVSSSKFMEFQQYFSNITVREIQGPHFLLQAAPIGCAEAIIEFAHDLSRTDMGR